MMNNINVTNKEELSRLWAETQYRQERLEANKKALFQKIDIECAQEIKNSTNVCTREYEAASDGVRKLLQERRKIK